MKIEDYNFKSFNSGEDKEQEDYSFEEFDKFKKKENEINQPVIKQERTASRESEFFISPIVLEYRGHNEQERNEAREEIKNEVERKLRVIRKDALSEGYNEGEQRGIEISLENTMQTAELALEELRVMIQEALDTRNKIFKNQKFEIIEIIKNVIKWVILKDIDQDDTYIERLLNKMLLEVDSRDNLLIKVNRSKFEIVPEIVTSIEKKLGEIKNVRIEIDDSSEHQGIVLESDSGILDGRLETQINFIDELFKNVEFDEKLPKT